MKSLIVKLHIFWIAVVILFTMGQSYDHFVKGLPFLRPLIIFGIIFYVFIWLGIGLAYGFVKTDDYFDEK